MNTHNKYDVIVVGGGPAGAVAGYYLAKGGARTLIMEKEKIPRYKTCGGGITHKAKSILPIDISQITEGECLKAKVVDHDNEQLFLVERDIPIITMVMRDKFDELLVQNAISAGAELIDNVEVNNVVVNLDETGNYTEVETNTGKFIAKILIAADGSNSNVRRLLKLQPLKKAPALEYEVFISPCDFTGIARFDMGFVQNGYAWVFPKREHLSIGVLSYENNTNLNEQIKRYLNHIGITNNARIDKHGFSIPCYSGNSVLCQVPILFCGDAAGLADPVTAEGISNAVLSGKLAAEAILQSGFDIRKTCKLYRDNVSKQILTELEYSHKLSKAIYSYPLIRRILFKLNGRKLSELIADIFLNERTYKKLLTTPVNYVKIFKKYY